MRRTDVGDSGSAVGERAGVGAADMSADFDVIVIGGGSPGVRCPGEFTRAAGSRSSSGSWVGGECSSGPASPRRRCCTQVRQCTPRVGSSASAEVDVDGAPPGQTNQFFGLLRRRPGALACGRWHRPAARERPATRDRRGRGRRGAPHRRTRGGSRRRSGARPCRPSRACASSSTVRPSREVTGMKASQSRLLVLGGGPVGVEMAPGGTPPRWRSGARRGRRARAAPRAGTAGRGARRGSAGRGCRACRRRPGDRGAARGEDYVLEFDERPELRGDRLLVATGGDRASRGLVWRPSESRPRATDSRRLALARRRAPLGDQRHRRYMAAYPRRQIPGRSRRRNTSATRARPTTRRYRERYSPTRRQRRWAPRRRRSAPPPLGGGQTETYTRAYAESNGFLTLLSDGERLMGAYALGPEAGSGCSRPRSRSELAFRSRCFATRSSPFLPSRRSTSPH